METTEFWQRIIQDKLATREEIIKGMEIRKAALEKNINRFSKELELVDLILKKL